LKNTPHNTRLIIINLSQTSNNLALFVQSIGLTIAISNTGSRSFLCYRSSLAPLDLCTKIFSELRVH